MASPTIKRALISVSDKLGLVDFARGLEAAGVEVIGPTDHGFCKSIYFHDPNGHRLELTVRTETPEMMEKLRSSSEAMLDEWTKTKTVQNHASWVHEGVGKN